MALRDLVLKLADLNLAKRKRVDRCTVTEEQSCVPLHDLVLDLCKIMEVDEQKAWHIGLIDAYRLIIEDDKVIKTRSGAWWKIEDDGSISRNLSRHLIASVGGQNLKRYCATFDGHCDGTKWGVGRH